MGAVILIPWRSTTTPLFFFHDHSPPGRPPSFPRAGSARWSVLTTVASSTAPSTVRRSSGSCRHRGWRDRARGRLQAGKTEPLSTPHRPRPIARDPSGRDGVSTVASGQIFSKKCGRFMEMFFLSYAILRITISKIEVFCEL